MHNSALEKGFFEVNNRALAYLHRSANTKNGFVWLGGYLSNMQGTKATFIDGLAQKIKRPCLRFDYSGHGNSGGAFSEGSLSLWLEESIAFYKKFCANSTQILIGSSMGGWLALRLYQELQNSDANIAGLILIAPAPDFTQILLEPKITAAQYQSLQDVGYFLEESPYTEEGMPFYKKFIEDSKKHLILNKAIEVTSPVFILQGRQDSSVPYQHALKLMEALPYAAVTLSLIPEADHNFSRSQDLHLLEKTIYQMTETLPY